jgi:hypothetical protein
MLTDNSILDQINEVGIRYWKALDVSQGFYFDMFVVTMYINNVVPLSRLRNIVDFFH